jgi:hypothetical protein
MQYDRLTRLMHLLLAIGISIQLIISEIMEEPESDHPADLFYLMFSCLKKPVSSHRLNQDLY